MITKGSRPPATILHSTAANLVGYLIPVVVQLVTVPLYLHVIGPERYGVMALVWLVLGYFGFFDLGFGQAMASRLAASTAESPQGRQEIFWTGTIVSLAAGLVGGMGLMVVARIVFAEILTVPSALLDEVTMAFPLLALALPVITGISAFSGTLQGCQRFVVLNFGQTVGATLYQIFPLLIAVSVSKSLPALVAAAIAGRCVTAVILFVACLRCVHVSGRPAFSLVRAKDIFKFGGWVTVGGVLAPLFMLLDRVVIGAARGLEAVTVYTVPFSFILRIGVLPSSLQNALYPRFAMLPQDEARRLLKGSVVATALLMTPLLCAVICVLRPFFLLWVGPQVGVPAAAVGQVIAIGFWFNALSFMPFSFTQSRGRPDLPAKLHVIELIFYGPLLFFLTRHFGVTGTAIAWSVRVFINMALNFVVAGLFGDLPVILLGLFPLGVAYWWAEVGTSAGVLFWPGAVVVVVLSILWSLQTLARPAIRMASTASQIWPMGIRTTVVSILGFWK